MSSIVIAILTLAGILYQYKYWIQASKIKHKGTSKGVARTYFLISIIYEFICTLGALYLQNWILLILSILPLIGNIIVFLIAVQYAPYSHKRDIKHRFYNFLKHVNKELEK